MKKLYFLPILVISCVMAFTECSNTDVFDGEELPEGLSPVIENVPYITATLSADATRTSFSMTDGCTLKAVWCVNDCISVVPAIGYTVYAGIYKISEVNGGVGVFKQETAPAASAPSYGIFYPGDKIKSMIQFMNFTYTGQVQSKADPMGHLPAYHVMFKTASSYATVDFSDAEQSSCMMFKLSGMNFDHPSRISLQVSGGGKFYTNNPHDSWYTSTPSETYAGELSTSELSLNLDGYGSETSLLAYMMMSSRDVTLSAGSTLRIKVTCADGEYYSDTEIPAATTLTGGYCHSLTVDGGWHKVSSADANVITLQTATEGFGMDLVIMGDGFREEDIAGGEYDVLMREAYDSFFSIQPLKFFKNYFNVYYVTAVSENHFGATIFTNGAENNPDSTTCFSVRFTAGQTSMTGDGDLVRYYASKAFATNAEERIKNATIIVLANEKCRAGTCHQSYVLANGFDYGQACAIAYCALGRSLEERAQLVLHEACGHGFGKLADEYYSTSGSYSTAYWNELSQNHELGMSRNVDIHVDEYIYGLWGSSLGLSLTTKENVLWHDLFGTANNYESPLVESLGVFVGANTQPVGFCRPTEDGTKSIMHSNTGIFNAPSRRTMYYRARRLSGEVTSNCFGSAGELSDFLAWDATYFLTTKSSATRSFGVLTGDALPYETAPMVLHKGHWEGTRFVEEP